LKARHSGGISAIETIDRGGNLPPLFALPQKDLIVFNQLPPEVRGMASAL